MKAVNTHSTAADAELVNRNRSATWSDEAFEATEFLFADYRDFAFRHTRA